MLCFNKRKKYAEYFKREKESIERIKNAVSKKCGIDKFIEYDDYTVAFAGSEDNMELLLELSTSVDKNGHYLCANIDDEVSFDECDFDSLAAFEDSVIEHISNRVNHTIKTIITKEKEESYRKSVYVLNEDTDNWTLIEQEYTEDDLVCRYFADKTETIEIIKTYKLEI